MLCHAMEEESGSIFHAIVVSLLHDPDDLIVLLYSCWKSSVLEINACKKCGGIACGRNGLPQSQGRVPYLLGS